MDATVRPAALRRLDVAAVGVVLLLGLTQLASPFTGDQALFMVGAQELRHGAVLYRDFWDVKQPGIYLYVLGALTLLGRSEVSVHVVDLVGWIVLAVCVQRIMRPRVSAGWVASVAPLLVIGTFIVGARPTDLTQVEAIVGLPLLGCLWLALGPPADGRRSDAALIGSGVLGGLVGLLKLVYLPIPVAFWLLAIRRRRANAVPLGVGVGAILVATVIWFAIGGVLGEVKFIYFDYTRRTPGIAGRPVSRLTDWASYSTRVFLLTGPLALFGAWRALRDWRARRVAPETLVTASLVWIAVGIPLVLVQHWWPYTMMLFVVPVGLLAVDGLDHVVSVVANRGRRVVVALVAAAAVLLVPGGLALARRSVDLAHHRFALGTTQGESYRISQNDTYAEADSLRAFLDRPAAAPGPIYVLSDPILQLRSGRDQAIAINGWSPEQYDAGMWKRIADELEQARPAYLVIDDFSQPYLDERDPALATWITSTYCTVQQGHFSWYARNDTADCSR